MLLITKRIDNSDICEQISLSDNVIALKEAITIEIYVKYNENGINKMMFFAKKIAFTLDSFLRIVMLDQYLVESVSYKIVKRF